jgi:hypothetical protein
MANVGILRLASDAVSRAFGKAGVTFGGKRDLYSALGYKRDLAIGDYRQRFKRNGIAARVVESPAKATWRAGTELVEDENPEVITAFEQAWLDLEERLQVWATFSRADTLAGLGRYAVLLIGAPGDLESELGSVKAENIVYLAPYGEDEAEILETVDETEDPRFGEPLMYGLQRNTAGTTSRRGGVKRRVHWSRVLHIADGTLEDRVIGTPRLERVWNWCDDLEKVTGGGSEAFWQRVHQGMHFELEKDLQLDPGEAEKVQAAAEELLHGMRRTFATRGMKMQMLGSDVANFNPQVDCLLTLISGSTGIPKRILMGSERGELASTQDEDNWNTRVGDRRKEFAEPFVVRPFVKRLMDAGALPTVEKYDVRWVEVDTLSDEERADIAGKWADLNGKAGDVVVTAEEIRDRILKLDKLTPEQLAEIEQKNVEKLKQQQEIMKNTPEADDPEDGDPPTPGKAQPRANRRPGRQRRVKPTLLEWVTSGKGNVCPVCEELEGQQRNIGEGFELEDGTVIEASDGAAHPNCDCQVVEVTG